MSVNHEQVARIAATALHNNMKKYSNFVEAVYYAWADLKKRRDLPGGSTDLDLAAAEHYLFARYAVASGNVSKDQMIVMAKMYYWQKKWDAYWGDPNKQAVTKNPVSKPDPGVTTWGIAGAMQGEIDHTAYKVGKEAPFWRPVKEILPGQDGAYGKVGTSYQ